MKVAKNILRLFILVILAASAGYAQQTFNQTVTAQNRSCNSTCTVLDVGDNINRALIIFATPVSVNGVNPNPQPIGAYWMYQNKWSIYNMNGAAMPLGTQFNVEYYTNADANHFVYFVPQRSTLMIFPTLIMPVSTITQMPKFGFFQPTQRHRGLSLIDPT